MALLFDDYHLITAGEVHEALLFLLEHLPEHLRLVMGTRSDPPLPLARLRARGQLSEVRVGELRFASAEVSAFVRAMGLDLSGDAVIHEPPLVKIHPNKQELLSFFGDIYRQAVTGGTEPAMNTFASKLFSLDMHAPPWGEIITMPFKEFSVQVQISNEFFLKNEILPFTNYEPDVAALKRHASKMMLAAGEQSLAEKRFYAETAPLLARTIAAEFVCLPGHHMSFLDHPKEWAAGLREALKKV